MIGRRLAATANSGRVLTRREGSSVHLHTLKHALDQADPTTFLQSDADEQLLVRDASQPRLSADPHEP